MLCTSYTLLLHPVLFTVKIRTSYPLWSKPVCHLTQARAKSKHTHWSPLNCMMTAGGLWSCPQNLSPHLLRAFHLVPFLQWINTSFPILPVTWCPSFLLHWEKKSSQSKRNFTCTCFPTNLLSLHRCPQLLLFVPTTIDKLCTPVSVFTLCVKSILPMLITVSERHVSSTCFILSLLKNSYPHTNILESL